MTIMKDKIAIVMCGEVAIDERYKYVPCYWYEEDIKAKEFAQEVRDLKEFYEEVVVLI